jgi:hypothetical protein
MTADHRPRRLPLRLIITALAVLPLLATGCSSSGTPADTSSHSPESSTHSDEGGSQSSDSARETAEQRLEDMGPQLAAVLADYRSGKKQQAYTLAKSVSAHLYEGTTEGIVSRIDPAGERQIDPLLAATLPAAIHNGESTSQVAALVHQAQGLATSCLAAIHKSEGSS